MAHAGATPRADPCPQRSLGKRGHDCHCKHRRLSETESTGKEERGSGTAAADAAAASGSVVVWRGLGVRCGCADRGLVWRSVERVCRGPTLSCCGRRSVVPRVRWRFGCAQAHEVQDVWPRQAMSETKIPALNAWRCRIFARVQSCSPTLRRTLLSIALLTLVFSGASSSMPTLFPFMVFCVRRRVDGN